MKVLNLKRTVRSAFDLQRHRAARFSTIFFVGLVGVVLIKNPNLAWHVVQSWVSILWLGLGCGLVYFLVAWVFKYIVLLRNVVAVEELESSEKQLSSASSKGKSLISKSEFASVGEIGASSRLSEVFEELLVAPNLEELRYKAKRCLFYFDYEVAKIDDDSIIEILIDHLLKTNHSERASAISNHFLHLAENSKIVE